MTDDDCVIEVGHRDARTRRAVWRDANAPHVIVCDRHRRQYEERPDLGPFAWVPIVTPPANPEETTVANHAERNADEVRCDRCRRPVQLTEDGDVQDDGSVLWSGAQRGECCGLLYAGAIWNDWVNVYDLEQGDDRG